MYCTVHEHLKDQLSINPELRAQEWGYYQWPNHYMAAHKNYPAAHLSMYSLLSTLQPMQYSIAHMYYVG